MSNLKNVNLMGYDKWQTTEKSDDELYNINTNTLPKSFFKDINTVKMPDYTAGVGLTKDVEYTAETNGVLRLRYAFDDSTTRYIDINGFRFTTFHTNYNEDAFFIPIKKGDVYTLVGSFNTAYFYPSI